MHERKAKMAELSDAFIALPGGYGTFEELFEALSWGQLGIHQKPVGILNIDGYYTPLVQLVEQAVSAGFMPATHRELLLVDSTPAGLLDKLAATSARRSPINGARASKASSFFSCGME